MTAPLSVAGPPAGIPGAAGPASAGTPDGAPAFASALDDALAGGGSQQQPGSSATSSFGASATGSPAGPSTPAVGDDPERTADAAAAADPGTLTGGTWAMLMAALGMNAAPVPAATSSAGDASPIETPGLSAAPAGTAPPGTAPPGTAPLGTAPLGTAPLGSGPLAAGPTAMPFPTAMPLPAAGAEPLAAGLPAVPAATDGTTTAPDANARALATGAAATGPTLLTAAATAAAPGSSSSSAGTPATAALLPGTDGPAPLQPVAGGSAGTSDPAAGGPGGGAGTAAGTALPAAAAEPDPVVDSSVPLGLTGPAPAPVATAAAAVPTSPSPPVAAQLAPQLAVLRNAPDGSQTMTLVITPESLGPVSIQVTITDGSLDLVLHGASAHGRAALTEALPDLRRDLQSAGLDLSRLEVDPDAGGSGARSAQQQLADLLGNGGQPRQPSPARPDTWAPPGTHLGEGGPVLTSAASTASGVDVRA